MIHLLLCFLLVITVQGEEIVIWKCTYTLPLLTVNFRTENLRVYKH
jgi:hypothetical protein